MGRVAGFHNLGISSQRPLQFCCIMEFPSIQIIVLNREYGCLVRSAGNCTFCAILGFPVQIHFQIHGKFASQDKEELNLLLYLFSFVIFLFCQCRDLKGIFPITCTARQPDLNCTVFIHFPISTITFGKFCRGDFHKFRIGARQIKPIFQLIILQLGCIQMFGNGLGRRAGNGFRIFSISVPGHDCCQIQIQFFTAFFALVAILIAFFALANVLLFGFRLLGNCLIGLSLLRIRFL